jgi:dTDP-4-amino-4,6-dideoxygalactose transaminase
MQTLAAFGGPPVRTTPFPNWPIFSESAVEAAIEVLRGRQLKYHTGGTVTRFEEAFAKFCGTSFVVCVFNGTVSLEVALRSLGVTQGSEAIIPAYDHPANLNSVLNIGAVPRFADVDYGRPNMSPRCAEALINARTKCIVVTHMVGLADVDAFEAISERYGLPVVYDCARVVGSEWNSQRLGRFGTISSFSFEESKLINAGEGGALAMNSSELAEKVYACRNRGRGANGKLVSKGIIGSNYRMTELQAALLLPQLSDIDALIRQRILAATYLSTLLSTLEGVEFPSQDSRCTKPVCYNIPLRYAQDSFHGLQIDEMIRYLNAEGIPCHRDWLPPYHYAQHVGVPLPHEADCPIADTVYEEMIVLPGHLLHCSNEDLQDIAQAFWKIREWAKHSV